MVTRFAQEGMPVTVTDVPDVVATVPLDVIKLEFNVGVPPIVGLVSVLFVSVCVAALHVIVSVAAGNVSVSFVVVPVVAAIVIEPEPDEGLMFKGIRRLSKWMMTE